MNRRLYRCRHDRRLAGVAAGVAEYFDADPTLVRILWFVSIFFGGLGIFVYIAMALIVPLEPLTAAEAEAEAARTAAASSGEVVGADAGAPVGNRHVARGSGPWATIVGVGLIGIGSIALLDQLVPGWNACHWVGPVLVIAIGAVLVARAIGKEPMPS
jgi:phage shock protein C